MSGDMNIQTNLYTHDTVKMFKTMKHIPVTSLVAVGKTPQTGYPSDQDMEGPTTPMISRTAAFQ